MDKNMRFRSVTLADIPAMLAIYEPYVLHTSVSFEYTTPDREEFEARLRHVKRKFPWLVCEMDGEVVGYAYASAAFSRMAYDWDADMSVYLAQKAHRKGIGRAFYVLLEDILKQQGMQVLYALVTSENESSRAFHEAMGYRVAAVLPKTGFKFGHWMDIYWYEKRLCEPVPPRDFPVPFEESMLETALRNMEKG